MLRRCSCLVVFKKQINLLNLYNLLLLYTRSLRNQLNLASYNLTFGFVSIRSARRVSPVLDDTQQDNQQ